MQRFDLSGDSASVSRQIVEHFLPTTDEFNPGADYYRGVLTEGCRVLLEAMKANGSSLTQELLADHLASYDLMVGLLNTLQPGEVRDHLCMFLEKFRGADGDKKFHDLLGPMGTRLSTLDNEIKHTRILAPCRAGMSFAADAFRDGFRITDADIAAIDAMPRVPQSIIDAIVAYGDARADHDAELGGARLAACIHALRKYVHDAKGEVSFPSPANIS